MSNLLWSGFLIVLLLSGCGWDGTPTRNNDFTPLTSITISAVSHTIAAKTSTTLTATGNFSGLYTRDITDQVVWSSAAPSIAAFVTTANRNRVSGLIPGSTTLTATVKGVSATFVLTVSSATLSTLTVTPVAPSVAQGLTTQCAVTGIFSDTTSQDLTFDGTWASSAPGVATVSDAPGSKGSVKALTVGTSTISASFNGISASTILTVTVPALQSIAISPANPSILTLSTRNFKATGIYSDGSAPDITAQVTWSSSKPEIASIVASGTATTLSQGTTTISASVAGVTGTTSLKTTGGNLSSLTLTPLTVVLVKDTTVRLRASGTFSNGSTRDISGAVTWSPANSSLATVTTPGGNLVWLNPLAVTPTTIIKVASGTLIPVTSTLTVTAPQLASIVFLTTNLELTAGVSSPLTVVATFSDNTTQDVTSLCTWISNDTTKATVGTSGLAAGRITGVAAGTTTISATYGGKTVPTPASVTVTSRNIQALTISGSSHIVAGNQVSFSAVASYVDGSVDVTQDAIWTIDQSNVAVLADSLNQTGQVVAVDNGTATLTASFGGKTQTVTIMVP